MRRQECLTHLDSDVLNLKGNKDVVSDAHSHYYYSDKPSETVYVDSLDNTSWDPSAMVHELKALDRYLKLEGVDDPSSRVVINTTRRRWLHHHLNCIDAGGVPPHDQSPESEFQRNLTQLPKLAGAFERQNSSSTTTMSRLPCTPRDSYQPRLGEGGQNISHRPSPSVSNPEPSGSIASSDANRPTVLSVASIFSQLTPDWEIEERTHLPLHLTNCEPCLQFACHVADFTRGGALSLFVNQQREHWQKALEEDSQNREDSAYSAGLDKGQYKIDRLNNELDECYDRLKMLKCENKDLRRELDEFKASNARASGGGASRGRNASRSPSHRKCSPPARRRSPAPTNKGKGKGKARAASLSPPPRKRSRPMYETDSDDTSVIQAELRGPCNG